MSSNFIHLHAHSEYSFDVGFVSIDDYVKFCYYNGAFASSLTERFNLCSFMKFYERCFDFSIKPIIGCEVFLEDNLYQHSKIILLCKNRNGYKNLTKLLTKAYLENILDGLPIIKREWFLSLSDGLIVIGLSANSDIGICLLNNDYINATCYLKFWQKALGSCYYLSINKFDSLSENLFLNRLLTFLEKKQIQLVATNEVCFLRSDDFFTYKSKIAIFDTERKAIVTDDHSYFKDKYFKSEKEMFDAFADMPELVINSAEIAKKCNLYLDAGKNYSPKYKQKNKLSMARCLIKLSFEKLFQDLFVSEMDYWSDYVDRLHMELRVINMVGFANYFLVTHDFIVWSKDNDIYVGPGRGSGAGSLVAYTLSITDIDPIKYDLLFERFLNHERISIPDFDVDLCIEGRDLVIDYIFQEYGINNVAQIITFGCMTTNAVVRDVGRVLGYSFIFVDKVIKLVSADFGVSLKHELTNNKTLRDEYDASYDIQLILDTFKLEGIIKGIGRHAGGLVISSIRLPGYLPLSYEYDDYHFMTQLDKIDAEKLGFIKFDFLGLKTLSIFSTTIEIFSSYNTLENTYFFNNKLLSLYNHRTYALLQSGDTIGIFQLESAGIKSVIQRLKPDLFSDIVALVALYRPGPLQSGMLHSFLARKLGLEKLDYIHPRLKDVLLETYGIVVYQEQVMLIAQVFAGYSVSAADFLRIAMSKKKSEMQFHLRVFSFGAGILGIDKVTAEEVFFLVDKFAGYGFNKAHSVGYALLAYNSAWLKANCNVMFMSALLSSDMYNYDNVELYIDECIHYSIKVFSPDINRGFYCFTMGKNYIHYGLGSIKGLGFSVVSEILHNRSIFGPYNCFFDFLYRIDLELLSKKTLQSLIYSGVFDKIYAQKFKLALIGIKFLDLYSNLENIGIYMTSSFVDEYFGHFIKKIKYMLEYKQVENRMERDILSDSILNNFWSVYKYDNYLISKLSFNSGNYFNVFLCGLIKKISIKMVFQEKHALINLLCFNKSYNILTPYNKYKFFKKITQNNFIVAICYERGNALYELLIEDFYAFRYKFVKYIDIILHNNFLSNAFLKKIISIISKKTIPGNALVRFKINIKNRCIYLLLNEKLKISLHDDFLFLLKKIKEIKTIEFIYKF